MFLLDKTLGKMGISEFYLNGLKKKKLVSTQKLILISEEILDAVPLSQEQEEDAVCHHCWLTLFGKRQPIQFPKRVRVFCIVLAQAKLPLFADGWLPGKFKNRNRKPFRREFPQVVGYEINILSYMELPIFNYFMVISYAST